MMIMNLFITLTVIRGEHTMAEDNINGMNQIAQTERSAPTDFNFAIGTWTVKHRRLKDLLSETKEWIEFEGSSTTRTILGGFGNLEDNVLHFPNSSFRAAALRSYDPNTKQWSIWWLDGRFPNKVDVPVVGEFKNKVGLFYAEDVLNNIPTKVRFTWDSTLPENPRWEQAFSTDNGITWQTNWTMSFLRLN